jgi:hypothetical protein
VAGDFFLPLMLAFFLSFLLSPLLRMLKRAHIPEAVGAALLLIVLVGGVGGGLYSLVTPATEWIAKAPASMTRIQGKLRTLRFPMEQMSRTADQVERTIAGDSGTAPVSAVKSPAWIKQALFGGTTAFVSEVVVVMVLLYFLLAEVDPVFWTSGLSGIDGLLFFEGSRSHVEADAKESQPGIQGEGSVGGAARAGERGGDRAAVRAARERCGELEEAAG